MPLLAPERATAAGLSSLRGDPGLPAVGHLWWMATGRAATDLSLYERFGQVYWTRLLNLTIVAAIGPDATSAVLLNRDRAFANGPGWEWFIGPFFARGLMLLDFEEHLRERHIMQAAFSRQRLEGYLAAMTPLVDAAVREWGGRHGDPSGLRFHPAARELAFGIAVRTFLGAEPGPEARRMIRAFEDCVRAGTAVVRRPVPGSRWRRGLVGRRLLEEHLHARVTDARRRQGEDLMSGLCHARGDDGSAFTDEQVVDHMIFLLMAAHDTSTSTMSSMAYFLAKHPEWQRRCREESLALGTAPSYADLDRLESLDLVMKESMRLVTPVPAVARKAVKDTELLGHFVPAGVHVSVGLQQQHLLPELWRDPSRFDPERFAPPRREDAAHRFAYLPFGGGAHKCIGMYFGGMEVKAVMHRMLLEYDWSVPPSYTMPVDRVSLPKPKDALPLRLSRR